MRTPWPASLVDAPLPSTMAASQQHVDHILEVSALTKTQPNIAAVILAAGGSTRFGRPKQLLAWNNRPLIAQAADVAWSAGLDPVIVVVGAYADTVIPALANRPVRIVRNYRWQEGMSSSLHVGIAALPPDVDAAIFMPIDQPLITPQLLQMYMHRRQETGTGILVPQTSEGQVGTPVLFAKRYFEELACLSGDVGGRSLFAKHGDDIAYLPISDSAWMTDVDTPETYEQLQISTGTASGRLDLSRIRGVVCDMDGVLWRGQTALPGLDDFFRLIHDRDLQYMLVTNNSSRTPAQYVHKLAEMGISTTTDHVLNSAIAAARHIADRQPGASIFAIGGPGVKDAAITHGLEFHNEADTEAVDYVVVGWDRDLTWEKLATATRLILNGATFIGTNPDETFPLEHALAPGNGAQTAALTAATGIEPVMAGKPAGPLYQQAMQRMHTTPSTTLVLGDRLDTDILGGIRLGMPTALLLTGISQAHELEHSPILPTIVIKDLPTLVRTWRTTCCQSSQPHTVRE